MPSLAIADIRRFCKEGRRLDGALGATGLPRLQDLLAGGEGSLSFVLRGQSGGKGQPLLQLEIQGALPLVCQRCLLPVEVPLSIARTLALVPEDAPLTQAELEDDEVDFLPSGKALDVQSLIEEEVLLALPIAARHAEGDAACALPAAREPASGRPNPFSALSALKSQ
jgi:uncharacterized protein